MRTLTASARMTIGAASVVCVALASYPAPAQVDFDAAGAAPDNPTAARSPWPQFHRNGYAQAASPLRGPESGESLAFQYIPIPRQFARGGAPTQMHLSEMYPDGSRTAWSTNLSSVMKVRLNGERFEFASGYLITPRVRDWSIHWNMQLARGNKAFVPDTAHRAILRFGEQNPNDPLSPIILEDRFVLPTNVAGSATVLNLSFDGWLVFVTSEGWVGAVRRDFSEWRAFDLASATQDNTAHNSFPIDEQGNLYIVSLFAMYKLRWTGNEFELVWRAPYNFRGEDCGPPPKNSTRLVLRTITGQSCTGSGTTPTLMGRGSMDRLVLAVDSARKNNLVAFWRDEIPADWAGLPGQDRRVAAVLPLPHSSWERGGFSAENSPPVAGYDVAVAQYSGFTPRCASPRGVQLARWDPSRKRFGLVWANAEVQFNNVMTISIPSGLLYGVGRGDDCQFVYRGLDRYTGRVAFSLPLGRDSRFADGGNSHALSDDRSIVFGVGGPGFLRVRAARD